MIALDTNVLVRFLVEDEPQQTERARKLVQRVVREDSSLFLADVVLCETVWVLESCYGLGKPEILIALRKLCAAKHVSFENPDRVARSMTAFEKGKGDFADYLIQAVSRENDCPRVFTFDRSLLREDGFEQP